MTAPISASWTRIENWPAEHAPATYAALAPPADPADIAATERVIGRPLPKPLVMSLSRHPRRPSCGLPQRSLVDTNVSNRDRQVRLSFLGGSGED